MRELPVVATPVQLPVEEAEVLVGAAQDPRAAQGAHLHQEGAVLGVLATPAAAPRGQRLQLLRHQRHLRGRGQLR